MADSDLLLFNCLVVSNYFWPHGLQYARLPCLSFTISGVCSNSLPLSRGFHPTISSFVTAFFSCPQSFSASGSFPMSQLLASGSSSFSINPPNEYSGLISFRTDWFDLLAIQGTLNRSLLQHSRFQLGGLNFPSNVLKQDWMATGVLFYLYAFSLTGN